MYKRQEHHGPLHRAHGNGVENGLQRRHTEHGELHHQPDQERPVHGGVGENADVQQRGPLAAYIKGMEQLAQGERIKEVLKQGQYQPMPVEYQVMIIFAATRKLLLDIPTHRILDFEKALFSFIDSKYPQIPASIRDTKQITEETDALLTKAINECKAEAF